MMSAVAGAPERQCDDVAELRGSVRVMARAQRWLRQWRATSPGSWRTTDSSTMIANAVELSALTEFVAIQRAQQETVDR
jgi:hypothetical protein